MDIRSIIGDYKEKTNKTLQSLKESEENIELDITYCNQIIDNLSNVFFYLEVEENPMVSAFNATNVDVLYLEMTTKLSINIGQPGRYCGLPDDCPCVNQFVVELADEIKPIRQRKVGAIVKSFNDASIVVNVITDTVSSSKQCTSTKATEEEFITVTLKKFENGDFRQIVLSLDVPEEVGGYWRDAKIFKHDGMFVASFML